MLPTTIENKATSDWQRQESLPITISIVGGDQHARRIAEPTLPSNWLHSTQLPGRGAGSQGRVQSGPERNCPLCRFNGQDIRPAGPRSV